MSRPAPKRLCWTSSTAPSAKAGPQLAPAPCWSSTAAGAAAGSTVEARAASTTTLRAARHPRRRHPQMALHAITPTERRAIVELFERWGDIDGGYRKLAHRGSYENLRQARCLNRGCHRRRCIAFSQPRGWFCPPARSAHPCRRGPCRTGSSGSATLSHAGRRLRVGCPACRSGSTTSKHGRRRRLSNSVKGGCGRSCKGLVTGALAAAAMSVFGVGAHNSVVGADQGLRAPSWDQESVRDSVHEDSTSTRIAARQRPRPSFGHPQANSRGLCPLRSFTRASLRS